jgi:hypothetical protein
MPLSGSASRTVPQLLGRLSEAAARSRLRISLDGPLASTISPLAVEEKPFGEERIVDREAFETVVDLAYAMPAFGAGEASPREVALYRALRGFGASESGFLDLAIALEAALLDGAKTERGYRFSLYGSLFLRHDLDSASTLVTLRDLYKVRSGLVHGGKVDAARRHAAESAAVELTRAVILRSLNTGWPRAKALDQLAIATPTRVESCGD